MVSRIPGLAAIALAALCLYVPLPSASVERWYSLSVYPVVQHAVTPVTNLLPFAVLDVIVLAAACWLVWACRRAFTQARRKRTARPLFGLAWHVLVTVAACYLAFLALWGLNYRRVTMGQRLELARPAPDRAAVMALGRQTVEQMNALYDEAHRTGWSGPEWQHNQLRVAFAETQRLLTDARPAAPGRVKRSLFGFYFRWSSVDGMINPFGLEVLANPDLLPWERPFVAAHEWSHLAGYAHEDEANFVGWLACIRADAPSRYSGWLFLYWQMLGELGSRDRAELARMVGPGPRKDLDAIADRLRRGQFPLLRDVSWRVYDSYLKANRVDEGVRSYSEVVTLILRARFDEDWTPVRRGDRRSFP